ncbi:hypothetical protein [Mycolicibacterium thermoresistibile]
MNIVQGAAQAVTKAASTTTAAAGAVGGAAVNGVVGGAQGVVKGMRQGAESGSKSTPAALLTLGAVAATGLVQWPVVLAVGGTAVLVNQLTRNGDKSGDEPATLRAVNGDTTKTSSPRKTTKSTPRKSTSSRSSRR